MKCPACGYEDYVYDPEYYGPDPVGFIELAIIEKAPFFAGIPEGWPSGKTPAPSVKRGYPEKMYACPECGAVRIGKSRL